MTTVVNIRNDSGRDSFYIGRKKEGMHYGNPFSHLTIPNAIKVASREEAILCFELWLDGLGFEEVEPEHRKWVLENMHELKDKKLGCFCAPLSCHGDVYKKKIDV